MPQRILIIDDNDTARSVMVDCLRDSSRLNGQGHFNIIELRRTMIDRLGNSITVAFV